MLHIPAEDLVLFICSPSVLNLDDLNRRGLYLSDIPLHVSPSVSKPLAVRVSLCIRQWTVSSSFLCVYTVQYCTFARQESNIFADRRFLVEDVEAVPSLLILIHSLLSFIRTHLLSFFPSAASSCNSFLSVPFSMPVLAGFLPAAKRISVRANPSEKREGLLTKSGEINRGERWSLDGEAWVCDACCDQQDMGSDTYSFSFHPSSGCVRFHDTQIRERVLVLELNLCYLWY